MRDTDYRITHKVGYWSHGKQTGNTKIQVWRKNKCVKTVQLSNSDAEKKIIDLKIEYGIPTYG